MTVRIKTSRRLFECRRKRRRGYTLVFFAMMLFAIMVLAALVIDIGLARLTQRQMQTAADSAAVEGLRREGTLDGGERRGRFSVTFGRGPTDAPDADLYANGPAVPYLFARGSLINRRLIDAGMTVSGTATAAIRPAKSIGFALGADVPGLTSFALPATGNTIDPSAPHFFTLDRSRSMPVAIGRELPVVSALPANGFTENGYAPVYATLSTGAVRIVGFVRASVVVTAGVATVTLSEQQTSSGNASAVICHAIQGSVTAAEMTEIVGLNQSLRGALHAIILKGASE